MNGTRESTYENTKPVHHPKPVGRAETDDPAKAKIIDEILRDGPKTPHPDRPKSPPYIPYPGTPNPKKHRHYGARPSPYKNWQTPCVDSEVRLPSF